MLLLIRFFIHSLFAQRRHGVHSPFVYCFGDEILKTIHFDVLDVFFKKRRRKKIFSLINAFLNYSGYSNVNCHDADVKNHLDCTTGNNGTLLPQPTVHIFDIKHPMIKVDSNYIIIVYDACNKCTALNQQFESSNNNLLLLDLFFIQIIIHHEIFKCKQNFTLR